MITSADFLPMLPELFLLAATCGLLLTDLFLSQERRGFIHFLALAILAVAAVLTLRGVPGVPLPVRVFSDTFQRDAVGDLLKLFIYLMTALAFVYAKPYLKDRNLFKGEFYMLCLFAVLGMMLLVSAGNLTVVYLGLELLALSSYALVAFDRDNRLASEAAIKYFVLGAMAGWSSSSWASRSCSVPRRATCGCLTSIGARRRRSHCSSAPRPSSRRWAWPIAFSTMPPAASTCTGRSCWRGWPSCRWRSAT